MLVSPPFAFILVVCFFVGVFVTVAGVLPAPAMSVNLLFLCHWFHTLHWSPASFSACVVFEIPALVAFPLVVLLVDYVEE